MMDDEIKKIGGEGKLNGSDISDFGTQRAKVFKLMSDGEWHTSMEVLIASGGTEGLRRLRELRGQPGVTILSDRHPFSRKWFYKMTIEEVPQTSFELK